jgi:hypothetical protein
VIVVVRGDEVRLQLGSQRQVGVAQPVHADHEHDVMGVGLAQTHERHQAHQQHHRQDEQREHAGTGPEFGAWATRAIPTTAADSTVMNIVARLKISFQVIDRVASRLQCSVARIWVRTASVTPLRSDGADGLVASLNLISFRTRSIPTLIQ